MHAQVSRPLRAARTVHHCLCYCTFAAALLLHPLQRPISVNFGMRMPGWYDIASLEDIDQKEDKDGLHESKR
jgi:hypothetical protein